MPKIWRYCAARWRPVAVTTAWLLIVLTGFSTAVSANESPLSGIASPAQVASFAAAPRWRALLDVGGARIASGDFYLAEQGRDDPAAELLATLNRLSSAPKTQCRFPARARFLRESGLLRVSAPVCPAWDAFAAKHAGSRFTVVLAEGFLDNIGSVFGHTLMRIDDPRPSNAGSTASVLTSDTVNFRADTRNTTGVTHSALGLLGAFSAGYELVPYYTLVNQHHRFEDRNLWEYPLVMTADENAWLLAHLWELRAVQFDYYFMQVNCTTLMVALIQAARPSLSLIESAGFTVVSVEMLDRLRGAGVLGAPYLRASRGTRLRARERHLSHKDIQIVAQLADPSAEIAVENATANTLDLAQDLLQYRYRRREALPGAARGRLNDIHSAQSTRSGRPNWPPLEQQLNPANPHGSSRLGVGGWSSNGAAASAIAWRLVHQDLLDPGGTGIVAEEAIALSGQLSVRAGDLRLDHLDILRLRAIPTRTALLKPETWSFALGLRRHRIDDGLTLATAAGRGRAWPLTDHVRVFGDFVADLQLRASDHALSDGWRAAAGARAGVLLQRPPHWAGLFEADVRAGLLGDRARWSRLDAAIQYSPHGRLGIRLGLQNRWIGRAHQAAASVSVHLYY